MADITDRPQSGPRAPERAAGPPLSDGDIDPSYRPLSLVALAGFGLSILFVVLIALGGWIAVFVHPHSPLLLLALVLSPLVAAAVSAGLGVRQPQRVLIIMGLALAGLLAALGLGGLLYYSNSDPWLLPGWLLVLPATALLAGGIARVQIQRSENTLSGLPLCNGGLGLVVVFGLLYAAYYVATVVAVRAQARTFADQWLEQVERGDLDRAFLLTLPPMNRPADNAEMRTNLETLFNSAGPMRPGRYDEFMLGEFVRLLQSETPSAKTEPLGLLSLKYEGGEYVVRYGYRVHSLLKTCEVEVAVHGTESARDESKGRQWYVDMTNTGRSPQNPAVTTAEGRILESQNGPAREFVTAWLDKWYSDDDDAYFWTLPPSERVRLQEQRSRMGAALGAVGLRALPWTEPHWRAFYDGALIEVDPKTSWISTVFRDAFPLALQKAFHPGDEKPFRSVFHPAANHPLIQESGDGKRFTYDLKISYKEGQKYTQAADVDAQIVLECDNASLARTKPEWQIKKLKLIRVRSAAPTAPLKGALQ